MTDVVQARDRTAPGIDRARVFALREAIARCGEAFAEFRSGTGAGAATPPWDAIVVTCATESQATAARDELERRRALGLFPEGCTLLALPDPPGNRAGSGGATLLALEALATLWTRNDDSIGPAHADAGPAGLFSGRRVLLVHSGGESQRLPAYAALGKIFAPLPVLLPQSAGSAIFDWLYLLASAMRGGSGEVTLLAGDVLPVFNPAHLTGVLSAGFPVCGVALPAPAATGTQFGVYVPGSDGAARRILQKPALAELAAAGAIDARRDVLVDTGIVRLGLPAITRLLEAAALGQGAAPGERVVRGDSPLLPDAGPVASWDLYRDWLPHLARERHAIVTPLAADVAATLAVAAEGLDCAVAAPTEGAFIHLGTSRDFHAAVDPGALLRRLFPFAAQRESAVDRAAVTTGAFVGRSLLGPHVRVGAGSLVDHCRVSGSLDTGSGALVSGLDVPPGDVLRVAPDRVCYQTVVRPQPSTGSASIATQRVTVTLGLDDNPKLALPQATFQGTALADWMAGRGVLPDDLWEPGTPQTLWMARLFVADAADPDRAVLAWLQDAIAPPGTETAARWRQAARHSLSELLEHADAAALAAWRSTLAGDVAATRVLADVRSNGDESFVELFAGLRPAQREETERQLRAAATDETHVPDPLQRARLWRVLADLVAPERPEPWSGTDEALREAYQDRAAAEVRLAVSRAASAKSGERLALRPGAHARVESPVRIDFGGGWTDTPPFSLERGGAVYNAALTLDGALPVTAEVAVLDTPELVLEADELDAPLRITTREQVAGHNNPTDPFALAKACLVVMGVVDPASPDPLSRLPAGMGLRLRTGSRVPRGSGLGGSSVVGAALLRALGEVLGQPQDDAALSRQTLELEQIMTTGGGWQDQMGAIAPGMKLVSTEPGPLQSPIVEPAPLTGTQLTEFESHLVVAYTGHHRLAKHILRQVVMRYLGRDPLAMQALYQLRRVAGQLARAAAAMDLELFGTLVNQAWLLNKTLDPQTSYPAIERLFSALAPHVYGAKLVGAGGGGFLIAVSRDPHRQELVADLMARDREFAYGYVVQHAIWRHGLRVSH